MKDLAQQGVSGVVIIRGDSAHLRLAPSLPSFDDAATVNRHDYGPVFHSCHVDEKPIFLSFKSPGLKLPVIATSGDEAQSDNCMRTTSSFNVSDIDNIKTETNSPGPLSPCLDTKRVEEGSSSSFSCPDLLCSSRAETARGDQAKRMTHSPGGNGLFGTTTDSSGQPPPFRMASSSVQHSEHQLSSRTESISGPAASEARPDSSNYPPVNQSSIRDAQLQQHCQQTLSSPTWAERRSGSGSNRASLDHSHLDTTSSFSYLAPPPSFEQYQEFHGTSQLIGDATTGMRPRHFSGGEIAIEMHRKQQEQQQQQQQQHVYQKTLHVQSHHERTPMFHGSAPFLSGPTVDERNIQISDTSALTYSKQGAISPLWTRSSNQVLQQQQQQHQQQHHTQVAAFRGAPSDLQFSATIKREDSSTETTASFKNNTSIPSSNQCVLTDVYSTAGSRSTHNQAVIASLPEIQMTEMLSEAEQAAPWMSHTPDNLSPTVQIVHKLAQATVSDNNRGQESPLTTCSSGNNSPRITKTAKSSSSVLQIPTPDISPSLSPTSCTKHKQRFIFPDVSVAQAAKLPSALTLESAGLNVSLAAIKSETHRWRHVSSGSSGDSSTAGEMNLTAPLSSSSSFASPQAMNMSSTSSSSGVTGSIGSIPPSRQRFCSGDTDIDDTLVDSETGSSVVEDSGSSREQSPFGPSAMMEQNAASSSAKSPTLRRLSPSGRRSLHRQPVVVASEDDPDNFSPASGEEEKIQADDERLQPPKFKRRLHERYVSSLREDLPRPATGEEILVSAAAVSSESAVETKPVLKLEAVELDSDFNESSLPKSPRRSISDDISRTDSYELSADEGDVFMEPISGVSHTQRLKPRNQQKPLDLSRSNQPPTPNFPHRSGSLPESDTPQSSPSLKSHYSPLFRSPHRLNFSPHGLMSPQSQSPLCSVPEGGRIFNFNMQPPFESSAGTHSDTDIISPSPMSPRFFTFPSIVPSHSASQLLNPMSEVNRLAVSPRALYPTSPIQFSLKSKSVSHIKWENLSKRSLSDSDVAYQCPICGQVFPSSDNLAKHMAKHLPTETIRSSDNSKIHYCKVCDRSFSRSDMLTRHMRLHTGLKPYECMDCGQVFSRSDHLNTHKRTHTGEKPYRCPHCPYAACRRDMITRHMRTHTKRTPKRNRYLSVPDNATPSTEGQTGSVSGGSDTTSETSSHHQRARPRTCSSLSSIDSLDLEMGPTSSGSQGLRWFGQSSVESQPPTEDSGAPTHASTSSHESEDTEEALLSPAQWHRKHAPSPLCHHQDEAGSGHHSMDDDAFLAAEPGPVHNHQEKMRPRESSPHPSSRAHHYLISPQSAAQPPLVHQGDFGGGGGSGSLHSRWDGTRPFPKSSSSSMSRESAS